jgi:DnaK suppressor protein
MFEHARPADSRRATDGRTLMLMEADATALAAPTAVPAAPANAEVQTANIRAALEERMAELQVEYRELVTDITTEERGLLVPDAGDDVVDIGTKAFNREQEISLANAVRDRIDQVERALERLSRGGYGWCERCAEPIPAARLAAFPSATLCVACKQLDERR